MFILDDGKEAYVFPIDENFKMDGIQDGDQVQVTYTGELSVTGETELTTIKVCLLYTSFKEANPLYQSDPALKFMEQRSGRCFCQSSVVYVS